MVANEAAFGAKAHRYETVVANDNALKVEQLIKIDGLASSLADSPAPIRDPLLWRMFAFNFEAGFGIFEQQKRSSSGQHVSRHLGDNGARARTSCVPQIPEGPRS
jgi:hypothetical protein